jgi:hypothetical protein
VFAAQPTTTVDEGSEEEEEDELQQRLARQAGSMQTKGKAKAKPSVKQLAKPKTSSSSAMPARATSCGPVPVTPTSLAPQKPAVPGGEAQAAVPDSKAAKDNTFALDGRGMRTKASLQQKFKDAQETLKPHLDFSDTPVHSADTKRVRTRALNTLSSNLQLQIKKAENSSNEAGVEDELNNLWRLASVVSDVAKFHNAVQTKSFGQDIQELLVTMLSWTDYTLVVGPAVWRLVLAAKCDHRMLFREYEGFCELFRDKAPEAPTDCVVSVKWLSVLSGLGSSCFVCGSVSKHYLIHDSLTIDPHWLIDSLSHCHCQVIVLVAGGSPSQVGC